MENYDLHTLLVEILDEGWYLEQHVGAQMDSLDGYCLWVSAIIDLPHPCPMQLMKSLAYLYEGRVTRSFSLCLPLLLFPSSFPVVTRFSIIFLFITWPNDLLVIWIQIK